MSIVVPGITHCEKHGLPIGLGNLCEKCKEEKKSWNGGNKIMTNKKWLLNKMQNMSDEELADNINCNFNICKKLNGKCLSAKCKECYALWLKAEHKEKITLSEAERVILENIDKDFKWICRDKDGTMCSFMAEPEKSDRVWLKGGRGKLMNVFNHLFQFITWNDEQPYNIEELLEGVNER